VRRVDARDPVPDAALANGLRDFVRDVPNGQPALCAQPLLALERLHRRPSYPRLLGSTLAPEVENVVVRRPTLDAAAGVAMSLAQKGLA
jgi:hypothetical protein